MKTLPNNWQPDENTDWHDVSTGYRLTEEFIREFKDEVVWYYICIYQKFSEDFIREFKDRVYWDYISAHQTLSESFILEFKDKVHWDWISMFQKHMSIKFLNKYQYLMDFTWTSVKIKYY